MSTPSPTYIVTNHKSSNVIKFIYKDNSMDKWCKWCIKLEKAVSSVDHINNRAEEKILKE